MLNGKSILVTGGTGSFGRAFIKSVLTKFPDVQRVVVYSRDELKQFEMAQLPEYQSRVMRFFIGDVRDQNRLRRAMEGIDIVIHAAALKQVPAAEYNPFEATQTNIIGAQNVIACSLDHDIERVVALSTDKAAAPINLYGATKLCSDKLFIAANNFKGTRKIRFSAVRYGNVMGSRGSVIPFFLDRRKTGVLPITDPEMTRFNITLTEGVDLVMTTLENMWGGEIFVPKIPSYRITDLAEAIGPSCKTEIVGIRPGEKVHEEMITVSDALNTYEFPNHFVILPSMALWDVAKYVEQLNGTPCAPDFRYHSGENSTWIGPEEIRTLIRDHVDPTFEVDA